MATVKIGDKSYDTNYANDPANQEEIRQAIVNGRNQVTVTNNQGQTFDNITGQQINVAPVKPKFDSQSYINGITSVGNSAIDNASKSREALINARLQDSISSQDALQRDAEGNLVKQTDTINANTYDAQENQRATGVQRGIQYSQQQQGIEAGISRAGTKMIVDAGKDRDTAIANIKDRIASLKSGASYEIQASQAQADSEKAKLLADTTNTAMQREWQLSDTADAQAYDTAKTTNAQQFATQERLNTQTFNEKMTKEGWAHDDEVAIRDFNDKVKLMNIDDDIKRKFLTLSTNEQLRVMGVQNVYDLGKLDKQFANEKIITGMNNATAIAMNNADNATSIANNTANINASKSENEARIQADKDMAMAKASAETNGFLNDLLKQDPTFNPYGTDAKSVNQRKYLADLNGVSVDTINTMLGTDPVKADNALTKTAVSQGVSTTTLKERMTRVLFGH